jgi:hypothetical protein
MQDRRPPDWRKFHTGQRSRTYVRFPGGFPGQTPERGVTPGKGVNQAHPDRPLLTRWTVLVLPLRRGSHSPHEIWYGTTTRSPTATEVASLATSTLRRRFHGRTGTDPEAGNGRVTPPRRGRRSLRRQVARSPAEAPICGLGEPSHSRAPGHCNIRLFGIGRLSLDDGSPKPDSHHCNFLRSPIRSQRPW